MDSTNRITVARVRAAMEETGATLMRGLAWGAGSRSGCPLGVVAVAEGKLDRGQTRISATWAAEALELTSPYQVGFVDAFDGGTTQDAPERRKSDYDLGHADGLAIVAELMVGPPRREGEAP
jgi:hypothetical protein